jgi:hypothetical protein
LDKQCRKCGEVKDTERDFYKDSRMPDGLRQYCKDCFKGYSIDNPKQRATGTEHSKGEDHYCATLTESDVKQIRSMLEAGFTRSELARRFNTSYQNIKSIHEYRTWKHI